MGEKLWNLEIARIGFIKGPRKIMQSTRWRELSWKGGIVWKKLKCKSSPKVFLLNVAFQEHPFLKKKISEKVYNEIYVIYKVYRRFDAEFLK